MYQLSFPKTLRLKNSIFRQFYSLLMIFFTPGICAQTVISGISPDFREQQIAVYRYTDMFSKTKEKVASEKIDDQGQFEFEIPLHDTQLLFFNINNKYSGEVLVEPGKNNRLKILPPGENVPITFTNVPVDITTGYSTNLHIKKFDLEYEDFLQKSMYALKLKMASGKAFQNANADRLKEIRVKGIAQSDSSEIDEIVTYSALLKDFKEKIKVSYDSLSNKDEFLREYIDYSLAYLELVNHSKEELYDKYLKDKLNFNNFAVVNFFNKFYSNLWEWEANYTPLLSILKRERNFHSLDTAAAGISFLEKEEIRHLALVNGLYLAYNSNLANRELILTLLVRHANETKDYSGLVATNYVNNIIQYKQGVKVRDFKILDKRDNIVTLDDLPGKYVYINFYTSWCSSCEGEMYIMNNLKKKYGKEIKFVSINLDEDYRDFKRFLSAHREFDWLMLYGRSEDDIMEIFNVKTIPAYVFIDPDGNWISSSAKAPSEGISRDFDRIMRQTYQAPKRYKVWDD